MTQTSQETKVFPKFQIFLEIGLLEEWKFLTVNKRVL